MSVKLGVVFVVLSTLGASLGVASSTSHVCPSGVAPITEDFDPYVRPYVREVSHCGDLSLKVKGNDIVVSVNPAAERVHFKVDEFAVTLTREIPNVGAPRSFSIQSHNGNGIIPSLNRGMDTFMYFTEFLGYKIENDGCNVFYPARRTDHVFLQFPDFRQTGDHRCLLKDK